MLNSTAFDVTLSLEGLNYEATRRVLIPKQMDLAEFHKVIQTAFSWTNSHLYAFNIGDNLEESFGIISYDKEKEVYSEKIMKEKTLGDYLPNTKYFGYTYDFGNFWEVKITLNNVINDCKEILPSLLDASGQVVPEDLGKCLTPSELAAILKDESHPEH